jgi:tetratricopeptide (TPR) repeat protein
METRDLLLLIGYLRSGNLFPVADLQREVPVQRTLHLMWDVIADRERTLFDEAATPPPPSNEDDIRRRSAFTAWSGDVLGWTSRIGEIPDPGVVLCLVYEGPATGAPLPVEVFSQTLRRFVLRDQAMRAKFEQHVNHAGTFVPPWLSPEVRRQRSWAAYDRAMKVAREEGFDAASPLLEGVRGDSFAPAQIALAMHELREMGDAESALERLDEVLRVAPRNVDARMLHAQILAEDPGRKVEAAADWLAVLRELGRGDAGDASQELREAARAGLWALHRLFRNPRKLEVAAELTRNDPERGFAAVSHYVHTHPCAWDAQVLLASLALSRQSFELTIKLLADVRWLYARDPNPHFVYGQALASKGNTEAAVAALEHAAGIAPNDADVARWLAFARGKLPGTSSGPESLSVRMVHHVARTLLLLVGFVRNQGGIEAGGHIYPAVLQLHRVPGDVSLALVAEALAGQEDRRFGSGPRSGSPPASGRRGRADREIDLRVVSERVVLLDQAGERMSVDHLVGDVPDPGVLLALLYETVERDAEGRPKHSPSPEECRKTITDIARADSEIAAKLERHLESPDATLMARLDRNR